jgi:hypothetical protein
MPALDSCHPQVVRALEKAGWKVRNHPLVLETALSHLFIDIIAERSVELNDQEIIVVKAKCFSASKAYTVELYQAIGQYLIYRELLINLDIADPLYLAIPERAFESVFKPLAMEAILKTGIKLLVVDMEREVITQWLD